MTEYHYISLEIRIDLIKYGYITHSMGDYVVAFVKKKILIE